jgi:hypothetical protein
VTSQPQEVNQKSKPLVSHTSRSCHLTSARKCVCKKKSIEPSKPSLTPVQQGAMHEMRQTGWYAQCNKCPICFFPFFHHVFGFILKASSFSPSSCLHASFRLASISRSSVLVSTKNICQLPVPHLKKKNLLALQQSKLTAQDPTPQQQRAEC